MALPSSQAVSLAVSQATPAQLVSLEDLLSYIRAEVQRTVSQSTSIAVTHDASPPPSSQHSSLPQPQLASAAGVSVSVFFCVIHIYNVYIYHATQQPAGQYICVAGFFVPHACLLCSMAVGFTHVLVHVSGTCASKCFSPLAAWA